MSFSKISKFFASGLILSSFCFANASEVKKDEDAPAAVEVKLETPKSDEKVANDSEAKSGTVKGENGENQEADSASAVVNLGSVSVKSSESCSETSFVVEKLANGIYVVRDADVPSSENSDVVSRTKVYTKKCVQVYNIFYDPSDGLVAQPVESSAADSDEKSNAASASKDNADKTSDQKA